MIYSADAHRPSWSISSCLLSYQDLLFDVCDFAYFAVLLLEELGDSAYESSCSTQKKQGRRKGF